MGALVVRGRYLRHIQPKLHHGTIRTLLAREDARELDMVTLNDQDRVGKQRVDKRRIPHQVPAVFGLGLESLQFLARKGQTMIETESLEVGDVAVQHLPERVPVQEANVIAFVESIHED